MEETLKEMGISDHLTCPLRNLYVGQEATVRTGHRKKKVGGLSQNTWLYKFSASSSLTKHVCTVGITLQFEVEQQN